MNSDSPVKMQVAVSMLPKLNTFMCMPLIEKCGGFEGFFCEDNTTLELLYNEFNIRPGTFDRRTALKKAEQELEEMDKLAINICSVEHHNYPFLLKQCPDSPLVFFYKGRIETEDLKCLAIVGTRKASQRCKERVETILKGISEMGHHPIIVSGLAFGIDASAHRASLKYQLKTYAVLGHGLQTIYPAVHKELAMKILDQGGALISEYPCCAPILPTNFLQRNRIIAGLCHATLIAESAEKGGAMSTARIAISYDRDVMAFPGRPEDKMSAGCNLLIKEDIAALIENSRDVARTLNLPTKEQHTNLQTSLHLFDTNDQNEQVIRLLTEKNEMNIDGLSISTGIPISKLTVILLELELEGKINTLPGKNYVIC